MVYIESGLKSGRHLRGLNHFEEPARFISATEEDTPARRKPPQIQEFKKGAAALLRAEGPAVDIWVLK